jgi:signal transduction histidine kinase
MASNYTHHSSQEAYISHELRIPLTGILGTVQFLKQTVLNSQQKHYLHSIQTFAKHLLGLESQLHTAVKTHQKISFPAKEMIKTAHSLEKTPLNKEQKEYLQIMLISVSRLSGLKQKLLAFVKTNSAQPQCA